MRHQACGQAFAQAAGCVQPHALERLVVGGGERPDAEILRSRLQKAVDQVLGKSKARVALASVIVFKQ